MEFSDQVKILRNWGLKPKPETAAEALPHTARRTRALTRVTDSEGRRWIIEEIEEGAYQSKVATADALEALDMQGLPKVQPYLRNSLGQFVTCYAGKLCMLLQETNGEIISIGAELADQGCAESMATFLVHLRHLSDPLDLIDTHRAFSIIRFVRHKTETLKRHRPAIAEGLKPVYEMLETHLFPHLAYCPKAFSHGRFIPESIRWKGSSIRRVVNWEYCDTRAEGYDAALMLGCIGFENPDALTSEFTFRFINRLRDADLFAEQTWTVLFDFMVALRYGWLSERIRLSDEKTRDMEILYMNLLASQREFIRDQWGLH